jgi:oligopeptidase A
VLERISSHYQTGASLPKKEIAALNQSRRFQGGLQLIRQLEFSLFDFQLHLQFDPKKGYAQIQEVLDTVRQKTRILPVSPSSRFQHSFAHIFSGGYGAGYYSYLWAAVLAADAFSRFVEEGLGDGLFNPKTGYDFMTSVLELGGSVDILELFKRFRGREPDMQAFLRQWGVLPIA